MTRYRTFTIGRHESNDLVISRERVSRFQAELVVAVDGSAFLTDRSSGKTTQIRKGDNDPWREIRQELIESRDTLRFADFEISVKQLLSHISAMADEPPKPAPGRRRVVPQPLPEGVKFVRRDPNDGRVIKS